MNAMKRPKLSMRKIKMSWKKNASISERNIHEIDGQRTLVFVAAYSVFSAIFSHRFIHNSIQLFSRFVSFIRRRRMTIFRIRCRILNNNVKYICITYQLNRPEFLKHFSINSASDNIAV